MWWLAGYGVLVLLCGIWAAMHVNDTDENGLFKVQWRMLLTFILFLCIPFVGILCGVM
jgi:hypothetical protein